MQSWRKEGIVGDIWSEPRNSQSCRNFFGSHPISFLTLRHPLWKMPLAGSEMSQLISKIITLNISTPGSVGEREPSPCLQACTPPHICIQAHPYPSLWFTHHDCQCVLGRPPAQIQFPHSYQDTTTGVQLEETGTSWVLATCNLQLLWAPRWGHRVAPSLLCHRHEQAESGLAPWRGC